MTYHWKEIAVSGAFNVGPPIGEGELVEMWKRKKIQQTESFIAAFNEDLYSTGPTNFDAVEADWAPLKE